MNCEYGEWQVVKSQSQLVLTIAVFKETCSHLKTKVIYK